MKRLTFIIATALAALLLSMPAWATGTYTPPPPTPTPVTQGQDQSQGQDQTQVQGQGQGQQQETNIGDITGGNATGGNATGGSVGDTSAVGLGGHGGQGGAGGSASNSLELGIANDINYSSKVRNLAFPGHSTGAFGSPSGCVGNKVEHRSILWNGAIRTDSAPASDLLCVLKLVWSENMAACQYTNAAYAEQRMMVAMVPGTEMKDWQHLVDKARPNLSAFECAQLLRPRLIVEGRAPTVAPVHQQVNIATATCPAQRPATQRTYRKKPAPKQCK